MKRILALFVTVAFTAQASLAGIARTGSYNAVAVQNRSAHTTLNANRNANVHRNVNVNQNVNVNRNVNVHTNVHGGYYGGCCYYQDNSWNWGSFAAGAAVGVATTAAVSAATRPSTTVVAAPAVGSVITALPGGCTTVAGSGAVIYQCSNAYYRPYYQGTTLVYQVVQYP